MADRPSQDSCPGTVPAPAPAPHSSFSPTPLLDPTILFSGRQIGQIFRQSGYKKCFQQLPLPFKNCLVKKKIYMNSSPHTELNRRRAWGSLMTRLTASPFSRHCPRVVKRGLLERETVLDGAGAPEEGGWGWDEGGREDRLHLASSQ